MEKIGYMLLITAFTLLSGFGDSQGFVHSAKVWRVSGKMVYGELLKAGSGFSFGIVMYWFALRYLNQLKMLSPEVQALGWFAATMIGIACFSGKILKWQTIDIFVALLVVSGIGWLLYHTEG